MKTIAILALIFLASMQTSFAAPAQERDLSSTAVAPTVTYKINDGYGEYVGQGPDKISASSQAREACVQQKISAYEGLHGGQTPDEDTADLFIDACINR